MKANYILKSEIYITKFNKKKGGFTLLELLIVIAVMSILTTVVFVALDPLARFQDTRNNRRWTDVNAILSAVKLDQVDNGGLYLTNITNLVAESVYLIGTGSNCNITCTGVTLESTCVDLTALATEGYLPSVPYDPNASGADAAHTGYYLIRSANGSITVGACNEEEGSAASTPIIYVKR